MFGLGMGEILFLGILALIVIGPDDLPKLARQLGRFLNEMKRSTEAFTHDLKEQAKFDPKEYLKESKSEGREEPKIVPPKVMDQMSDEEYQLHIGGNHHPTKVNVEEAAKQGPSNSNEVIANNDNSKAKAKND